MTAIELWIAKSPTHLAQVAAELLLKQIQAKPQLNLSCATGATPVSVYAALADLARQNHQLFADVHCFHLDEYVGMSKSDPRSYAHYIQSHVLDPLGISESKSRLWRGDVADPHEECAAYERDIRDRGGIDFQILGLGLNGHIAFNEPGTPLESRCHMIALTASTLEHNAPHLGSGTIPTHAMTAGIATIMDARQIVMLVSGKKKAAALHQFFTGPISSKFPASFLRQHTAITVIADLSAIDNQRDLWKGLSVYDAP